MVDPISLVDVYNEFSVQTKKNFKSLMVKIFDDEDIVFNDLISYDRLNRLLDVFRINGDEEYTEKEVVKIELDHVRFRVSENIERLEVMKKVVDRLEIQHISEYDEDDENSPHFWTKISTVEMLKSMKRIP